MKNIVTNLQPIGRALMLPIAVLPAAALLLRLGQPDLLNIAAVAAAGNAIFSNLGLLFAIGVAVGLARENHGAAGLASVVGFLVTTKGAEVLIGVPSEVTADLSGRAVDLAAAAYRAKELAKLSVPAGLINGLLAGWLYNRYSNVRLPSYLAFFAGRRFVPIASGFAGILLALCFGYGFPMLERGMDAASHAVLASDAFGQFIYGVLNRVLIVTGLHHILNNIAWFLLGEYNGVTGDLNRFFAGDPTAGAFMSGFFPVMMFGLPAACLAMYRAALPEKRNAVAGLLLSMALTSFLTGVTEPIEFSFMFLAPVLYAVHAVLTGAAMALMAALDVRLGFGFSAGLFDYVLNFKQATRPLLLVPIGLVYFGVYYGLFRFFIVRLDLKTPGREVEEAGQGAAQAGQGASGAAAWVHALGGARNLVSVDACTTRLRLIVADQATVNEGALKRLGARGVVRPSAEALQVVVGPIADQLASDIRSELKTPSSTAAPPSLSAASLLEALGGRANVRDVRLVASRLSIAVKDPDAVVDDRVAGLRARGIARPAPHSLHIVLGPSAGALYQELSAIL
ncbi:MAG TPA: N-acetylglucosamine-specific PTS transporter subunit IIBC [Steroidobacteraceae bacterium]|nr:N-acetylglucosamine-specific PTS transporter subunit IIBC [Steroidobacteraceae bacterium]